MTVAIDEDSFEIAAAITAIAAKYAADFKDWAEPDDIASELWIYALSSAGQRELQRNSEPGREGYKSLALYGVARQYCEMEKAAKSGYRFEDIAWYAPEMLINLVHYARMADWDGQGSIEESEVRSGTLGSEGGSLLARVADVKFALAKLGMRGSNFDPLTEDGMENLVLLSDKLGGQYPAAPGYRRQRRQVVDNATAQARTGVNY